MKSHIKNKVLKSEVLLIALAGLVSLSACTKKIPFENLPTEQKEKDVSKSLLDTNAEYLYAASQQNASRSAGEAFPFQAGDTKRVKLELTKDSLRIVELERDERFASNAMNNKLVLEIPVSHVQYACKKDRYGECTNTEEESTDLSWHQKDTVRVKLEDVKSGELELLPLLISSTVGANCYENVSSKLIKSTVEKDAINFQIERIFKTRLDCLPDDATQLSDATISAVYHYSLLKTSAILSKDYKVVSYPEGSEDEQSFGFFSSQRTRLDVDNNNTTNSKIQIMNRWNPNRSEIVYHLSDEFDKPENKTLKDLTFKTVNNLNKGLELAGVKFRINLKNPSGKVPGDIRNSMIILVEDPVASSVIGYGPQTEDPVTGEIISARTVMFLGTIKKFAKYTYDEIVREKQNSKTVNSKTPSKTQTKESSGQNISTSYTLAPDIVNRVTALKKTGQVFGASAMIDKVMAKIATSTDSSLNQQAEKTSPSSNRFGSSHAFKKPQIQKAVESIQNYTARKNDEYSGHDLKSKIKYLQEVKNCAFAPAMETTAGGISQKLLNEFPDDAKPWHELSEKEKDKALAVILPEIWIPTLIHELGHNLGLRHNFAGSEDKNNFYSSEELAKMGIDHHAPFSSVMDYGNDLKTLPALGKYDIAALRFGYLRKVEVLKSEKEEVLDIPSTLENLMNQYPDISLKEFKFCTDEHTGINAGCKRFDLGTSYTEIVQNIIRDYENAYSSRNHRDGRANFSHMNDFAYLSRITSIFKELRIMMEVVERIKYDFRLADDAAEWESVPFLKDLRQATLLGGSFLTNVILVPDIHCAIALAKNPQQIIAIAPAAEIDPNAMSCKDLQLKAEYKIVGQTGKSLNSKKDPNNRNPYMDQIDVRGIWLDKVAAIQTLTARTIDVPNMNNHTDNFLNVPELRKGIIDAIHGLMTNNVVNKVEFTMIDGSKRQFEISYDMHQSQLIQHPLILDVIDRSGISEEQKKRILKRLGVYSTGTTPLQKIVASTLAINAADPNRVNIEDNALKDLVSVYKFDVVTPVELGDSKKRVTVDGVQYVADTRNILATRSIELLPIVNMMDELNEDALDMVLDVKKKKQQLPPLPEDETDEVKKIYAKMQKVFEKVDAETIENYLMGVVKNAKFYKEQLQILPAAN